MLRGTQQHLETLGSQVTAIKERLKEMRYSDYPSYDELLEGIHAKLGLLTDEARTVSKQQTLLDRLRFPNIYIRRDNIKDAHRQTFEWIFSRQRHNFMQWLEKGGGIYWVQGKPGSGKSTLMRFLVEHPRTKEALISWARGRQLVVASHFFWIAGQPMQKSRAGLIRTLLFQVLRQRPNLIPTVFPSWWMEPSTAYPDLCTDRELLGFLRTLTKQNGTAIKFCFFIDGLDEYTGGTTGLNETTTSYDALLSPLVELSASEDIKICVSSRPWTPFEEAFRSLDTLKVQDLTRPDIDWFVRDRLGSHNDWKRMCNTTGKCEHIVEDIILRAEGVFLWVSLVVESLHRGLKNTDSYEHLCARLDEIPDGLEPYFKHMLRAVEKVYWSHSLKAFQVATHAKQSLPLLVYDFLDQDQRDPSHALRLSPQSASEVDLGMSVAGTKKRLRAYCGDLLEVAFDKGETLFMSHKVSFLHRTVRDFFISTPALENMRRERGDIEFDPSLFLGKAMLALTKVYHAQHSGEIDVNTIFTLADGLMYHTWEMENDEVATPSTEIGLSRRLVDTYALLEDMDRTNSRHMNRGKTHWTNFRDIPEGRYEERRSKNWISTAVQGRLALFVKKELEQDPPRARKYGRPLLDYALRPKVVSFVNFRDPEFDAGPVPEIVEFLLATKIDKPNGPIYIYGGRTPWQLFLETCLDHSANIQRSAAGNIFCAMKSMLVHGANPSITIVDRDNRRYDVVDVAVACGLNTEQTSEIENTARAGQLKPWVSAWIPWGWIPWVL